MKAIIPNRIAMILFAVPFAFFGINHLMHASAMAPMVPFPPKTALVYLTGIVQLLAALSFLLNIKVRLAAYLLALYLLGIILSIHLPQTMKSAADAPMLVKDIALMAGAILLANQAK